MATASAKTGVLSYADRAKRAGVSTGSATPRSRPKPSPASAPPEVENPPPVATQNTASQNVTPISSATLTRPATPPPVRENDESSHQPESVTVSPKPVAPTNVWAARKEQMAQRAAATSTQQQPPASQPLSTSQASSKAAPSHAAMPSNASNISKHESTSKPTLNGNGSSDSNNNGLLINSKKDREDPFVVRIPPPRTTETTPGPTPPSLDDAKSWPEMGKIVSSSATSPNLPEGEKRDLSVSATPRKSEKPKWVPIPAAELQAAADALSQGQGHHRTHSQHTQRKQPASRRQSHSRNASRHNNREYRTHEPRGPSDEGAVNHSQGSSMAQSRVGSVHSSPRYPPRGRRLPEDAPPLNTTSLSTQGSAAQNPSIRRLQDEAGENYGEGVAPPQSQEDVQVTPVPTQAAMYGDASFAQVPSGPPYQSQSHIYYPPPVNSPYDASAMRNVYNPVAPNGYVPPMMPPNGPPHMSYPMYPPYPPPGSQHPPYASYMYMPYPYYPPPMHSPGQAQERLQPMIYDPTQQQVHSDQPDAHSVNTMTQSALPRQLASPVLLATTPAPLSLPSGENTAGYHAITAVSVNPLVNEDDPAIAPVSIPPTQTGEATASVAANSSDQQVLEKEPEMLFGSIGRPGGLKSPSPLSSPIIRPEQGTSLGLDIGEKPNGEATFPGFTIGMDPNEPGRNGTDSLSISDTIGDYNTTPEKPIDLTDPETTLEFGTSNRLEVDAFVDASREDGKEDSTVPSLDPKIPQPAQTIDTEAQEPGYPTMYPYAQYSHPQPMGYAPYLPMHMVSAPLQSSGSHIPAQMVGQRQSIGSDHMMPNMLPPLSVPRPVYSNSESPTISDDFEVKDYGYGFGPNSGGGYLPERQREDRVDREQKDTRDRGGEYAGFGRNRRGSAGAYGSYNGGYERGSFRGRRGRGGPSYGRGAYGSRGGYSARADSGQRFAQQQSASFAPPQYQYPPHSAPPTHHSQASETSLGYYPSPPSSSYMQSPYTPYPPPLPAMRDHSQSPVTAGIQAPTQLPMTNLAFPVDNTRFYLLGQIEYYFSIQNLAQDFFLRTQMDSRGWVPIPLIASFNRVKRLTQDANLVRDALTLSTMVEVNGDYVRLSNDHWRQWVLPQAQTSLVEESNNTPEVLPHMLREDRSIAIQPPFEGETEEDEEDDVVFVLDHNASHVE